MCEAKTTENKKVIILGGGPNRIGQGIEFDYCCVHAVFALKKMETSQIILSNRTKKKAEELKKTFPDLEIINWGETPEFNMIINATSLGLNKNDEIKLDYEDIGSNKFFYDVIYNPKQTKFLSTAKHFGNQIENGKMMFIYQAHQAFTLWHKIMPKIDDETIKLLD